MARTTKAARVGAVVVTSALAVTACGGPVSVAQEAAPAATTAAAGSVVVRGCTPQYPLLPALTYETCGAGILDAVLGRLVRYDAATGRIRNELASSITTKDAKTYRITLKAGLKFSNGTALTARHFVDAWNFAAYGPNGQLNSFYFEVIRGYPRAARGEVRKMSGLKVVNDRTFTVELLARNSTFRQRLGYHAFAPLPKSFFADNGRAFGKKPIGAGPYNVVSFSPTTGAVLRANPAFVGSPKPTIKQVTFKFFNNVGNAYKAMRAGNLDLLDEIPTDSLIDDLYKDDLGGRTMARTVGVIQSISFPPSATDPSYRNPKLRQALSLAIDRKSIIRQVFGGTRTPATGWVAPVAFGYQAGGCGTFCAYDPARARELYEAAGGHAGPITITYNGDAAHKDWVDAACESISDALDVDCLGKAVPTFAEFRSKITARKMKGLFRAGWQMDYPSIENFLTPLYRTGAYANDGAYSNKTFDAKLAAAAATLDPAVANATYREAERLLRANMPAIPLWYGRAIGGYSQRVTGARFNVFGIYDLINLKLK